MLARAVEMGPVRYVNRRAGTNFRFEDQVRFYEAAAQREPDPTDRRTAVLTPTAAGLELARRAVASARRITEATLAPLAPDERRHFLTLLRKLG